VLIWGGGLVVTWVLGVWLSPVAAAACGLTVAFLVAGVLTSVRR
jgi:hypothetical protein